MNTLIANKRYIFYEKRDNDKEDIFEAEFIDIILDTIRFKNYQYLNDNFIVLGKLNTGLLTMPVSWIAKFICKDLAEDYYLKQIYLEI